jgi:predicted nucleic acid-binding Zn ribbon protein
MEPVRTGLRRIAGELLRNRPAEEAVTLCWPLVCGKDVAARTHPVSFVDGRFSVEVPDAAWRTQLISFAPRYVAAFAELLGPVVQEVRFVGEESTQHSALSIQPRKTS